MHPVALHFMDCSNLTAGFQSIFLVLSPKSSVDLPTTASRPHSRAEPFKINGTFGVDRNKCTFENDVQYLVESISDAHLHLGRSGLSDLLLW